MSCLRIVALGGILSLPAVLVAAGEQGDLSRKIKGSDCLAWTVETYRIEARLDEFALDFAEEYAELVACVERDLAMMPSEIPLGWCDNVLKVHCSALDLLTEIGEAEISRCEESLGASLGIDPGEHRHWRTCGRNTVFDRSQGGASYDPETCRSVLLTDCGTRIEPELSSETRSFVDCCTAAAIDPADREAGRCSMIDESFTRGPCLDRPVCVNRETGQWLACASGRAWRQWGGPNRDFKAPVGELAEAWPEEGPAELWSRPLGDGYSAILYEDGRLYTMYRSGETEVVVSLDASTGATVWERSYSQPPHPKHLPQYGTGPRSTPVIDGDRLFTIGVAGRLMALDKRDGRVLWSRELWGDEVGGRHQGSGYSSSPLAHGGMVIVPVGGEAAGVVAFDQEDGSIAWKSRGFRNSYSSPAILEIAGRSHLVVFMAEEVIGLDPDSGELLWTYPHANQWGHNINVPVAVDDLLFISSPQAGSRGIRLIPDGDGFEPEELWSNRRVQLYHVASVQDGDWVYGSTGTSAPAFLVAINVRTGEIGWRERGIAKANCVAADGKLMILDEDGVLYLATATPEKLVVHDRTQLLERTAWTAPTLVGRTLYARDTRRIVAVDLGRASAPAGTD